MIENVVERPHFAMPAPAGQPEELALAQFHILPERNVAFPLNGQEELQIGGEDA